MVKVSKGSVLAIELQGLSCRCIIGALPHERRKKQKLILDVSCIYAESAIPETDKMEDCVDYCILADTILSTAANGAYVTLEFLCRACAEKILGTFPAIREMEIRASKPAVFRKKTTATVVFRTVRA